MGAIQGACLMKILAIFFSAGLVVSSFATYHKVEARSSYDRVILCKACGKYHIQGIPCR